MSEGYNHSNRAPLSLRKPQVRSSLFRGSSYIRTWKKSSDLRGSTAVGPQPSRWRPGPFPCLDGSRWGNLRCTESHASSPEAEKERTRWPSSWRWSRCYWGLLEREEFHHRHRCLIHQTKIKTSWTIWSKQAWSISENLRLRSWETIDLRVVCFWIWRNRGLPQAFRSFEDPPSVAFNFRKRSRIEDAV